MSAIDPLLHANQAYAATFSGPQAAPPTRHLAVLTCMDCRIDVLGALGLQVGEAHVLRNAGGLPTDDMLRSLVISQRKLGTREVAVIHHTSCGMQGLDDDAFRAELAAEAGAVPPWQVPGFDDLQARVRESVALIRDCPWLPHRDAIRGFVFDIATGRIDEVS